MKRRVVRTDKVPPARTTFQAAGLVAGARVEINAIATV
ncbi:MAG TPA: RidA family protein [Burkholderiales bacterium]